MTTLRIQSGANTADIAQLGIKAVHARKIARYAAQTRSEAFTLQMDGLQYDVSVVNAAAKRAPAKKSVVKAKTAKRGVSAHTLGTSPKKIMTALDARKIAYRDLDSDQQAVARSARSKRAAATAANARGY